MRSETVNEFLQTVTVIASMATMFAAFGGLMLTMNGRMEARLTARIDRLADRMDAQHQDINGAIIELTGRVGRLEGAPSADD